VWTAQLAKIQFAGWKVLERLGDVAADAATWAAWTPHLTVGATLHWRQLQADQVFSRPRGRYTEASLIADLEKRGIGRPSTFASLVGTLLDRGYVEKTNAEGRQQTTKHLQIVPAQWPPVETTQRHTVGADKNKLRTTPLGKSVATFLYKEFSDLFAYEFTARMEQRLDEIAQGAYAWKTLLQETWDTYKARYAAAIAGGAKAAAAARTRILATGDDGQILKVIQSSKGPLFVRETPVAAAAAAGGAGRRAPKAPKPKAEFAPLPSGVAFESATAADAERALAAAAGAAAGELLGVHGGKEIRKKKGPYGFYADMEGIRVPLRKPEEPFAAVVERLEAKAAAASAEGAGYERKIGDYTIKRGPYGLYMFKHTLKRQTFVKFPEALDPDTINAVDAAAAYSNGLVKKRHAPRKTAPGAKKDTE
jgi:DNA topoisomerase-1